MWCIGSLRSLPESDIECLLSGCVCVSEYCWLLTTSAFEDDGLSHIRRRPRHHTNTLCLIRILTKKRAKEMDGVAAWQSLESEGVTRNNALLNSRASGHDFITFSVIPSKRICCWPNMTIVYGLIIGLCGIPTWYCVILSSHTFYSLYIHKKPSLSFFFNYSFIWPFQVRSIIINFIKWGPYILKKIEPAI